MLKSANNQGFTLVEAMMAIVILMIGLFAVMQFFPFGLQIIGNANNRTIAANLAQSKIEEVRSQNYDDISTGTIEAKHRLSDETSSYLYNYQRETTVTIVDTNFNTSQTDVGLKKISTTVYWQSPITNSEKSFSINSIAANF